MSLNFPNAPIVGQVFEAEGQTFVWNGAVWIMQAILLPWATAAEAVAGTAADKVLSPAVAGDLVRSFPEPSDPFAGVPTDVRSQRAANTDYQNTLGRPMFLFIEGLSTGNTELLIGPAAPAATRIAANSTTVTGHVNTMSAFIPDGWFYRWTTPTGTINRWHEWR